MWFRTDNAAVKVVTFFTINMLSSMALAKIELYLSDLYEFPNITMTALFLFFNFVGLIIWAKLGIFELVKVPISDVLPIATMYCLMFILNSLSLEYNSRGTHDLLNVLMFPVVIIFGTYVYGQSYSHKIKFTVVS